MKSNIEKIITENRESFNDAEPGEGHFERFGAKLDKEFGKKKKLNFRIAWQIAATVAFVFIAINQALVFFSSKQPNEVSLTTVSPEYREMENYYVTSINTSLTNWDALQKKGALSSEERTLLDQELKAFEITFKSLQHELQANPNDERVINAMIEFYQSKLAVITIIMDNLKEVKQLKNTNHETKI